MPLCSQPIALYLAGHMGYSDVHRVAAADWDAEAVVRGGLLLRPKMCFRRRPEASAHFYGEALRARFAHAFALDPELTPTPVGAALTSRAPQSNLAESLRHCTPRVDRPAERPN
jgi:hypothetical protein